MSEQVRNDDECRGRKKVAREKLHSNESKPCMEADNGEGFRQMRDLEDKVTDLMDTRHSLYLASNDNALDESQEGHLLCNRRRSCRNKVNQNRDCQQKR